MSIWFDADADQALRRLESDPTAAPLLTKVAATLALLDTDPGHETLRRRRFRDPALWCVTVIAGEEALVILWEPHPTIPDDIVVQYLGPDSF
jgi:hypothetical protein